MVGGSVTTGWDTPVGLGLLQFPCVLNSYPIEVCLALSVLVLKQILTLLVECLTGGAVPGPFSPSILKENKTLFLEKFLRSLPFIIVIIYIIF